MLNRGAFTALVEGYLAHLEKDGFAHKGGALLIVDADNFKSINDTLGHDAGDEALRLIARSAALLRTTGLVGRIGGEEFAVFLPGSTPLQAELSPSASGLLSRRPISSATASGRSSVSVGGAVFDRRPRRLFRLADQQLYSAVEDGRNRVSVAPITHYETVPMSARRMCVSPELLHVFVAHLEVGIDVLHVVVLFENADHLEERRALLAVDHRAVLRRHGSTCRYRCWRQLCF